MTTTRRKKIMKSIMVDEVNYKALFNLLLKEDKTFNAWVREKMKEDLTERLKQKQLR